MTTTRVARKAMAMVRREGEVRAKRSGYVLRSLVSACVYGFVDP
jgi:hypothetical protein